MTQFKKFVSWVMASHKGSNHVSLWVRKYLERVKLVQVIGVNLAGLAFAAAVVVPQTKSITSDLLVTINTPEMVTIQAPPDETSKRWPVVTFGISQSFHYGHGGMDLTAPEGTPVYPVAPGTVLWTQSLNWGYGNHVFIKHTDIFDSLYAHLSTVNVSAGQTVTTKTVLGTLGHTGWATGDHLHLETYENGVEVDPIEVLPTIE